MRVLNPSRRTPALLVSLILACPGYVWSQQPLEAIDLQAETSSYDRQNGHLVFTRVNITQGKLGISAALAEATELQFEDSSWRFSGDVRIVLEEAIIVADEALIEFTGHNLRRAAVTGEPATIEGTQRDDGRSVNGRATRMEYDHVEKTLRLVGSAWITEGQNEISGSSLLYDFDAETVIAGDPERQTQDVRIIIKPPESLPGRLDDAGDTAQDDDAQKQAVDPLAGQAEDPEQ